MCYKNKDAVIDICMARTSLAVTEEIGGKKKLHINRKIFLANRSAFVA